MSLVYSGFLDSVFIELLLIGHIKFRNLSVIYLLKWFPLNR